jgi:hypothetical protein
VSSITINGTSLTSSGTQQPTLEASGTSAVYLAGGNTIANSGANGTAIELDHTASLYQQDGTMFGYANAADSVSGAGTLLLQSSIDMGQGVLAGNPTMSWNGAISAQQNSSFRLSGGVAITGSVVIEQNSNGFFNDDNGGSGSNQTVSGSITCPFINVPASHVSSPTSVTAGSFAVATSFSSAVSGQCLPF